jgi:hypothetical protein
LSIEVVDASGLKILTDLTEGELSAALERAGFKFD